LGDVCGKAELTPVAIAAGRKLAARLFNSKFFIKRILLHFYYYFFIIFVKF
jgi:pyruvate/2-oxoglutarate dehydrogenase complex dihydrolipoamide dehydrogenase (E3) component